MIKVFHKLFDKFKLKRIQIIGIRGKNNQGNIAIDDISFIESSCKIFPNEVNNELSQFTTTARPITTAQIPTNDKITCNFDQNNTCGWIDDTSGQLKWSLNKGFSSYEDTGPISDVSGNGYYIYLKSLNLKEGYKARILSPTINTTLSKQQRINLILFNLILYLVNILF